LGFLSDYLTLEFLVGLLVVIGIDLVLAGDNAIVIALAARNLPKGQQGRVVVLGTIGAIAIRAAGTLLLVNLLSHELPVLMLAGGLILLWISYKLLVEEKQHDHIEAKATMWAAVRTIIIADAAMGLDNVLAVAGAAKGQHQTALVILGLLISVPIVIWGSTLFIKLIEKFAWILYAGAAVLAFTAAKMITHEVLLKVVFDSELVKWAFTMVLVVGIVVVGKNKEKQKAASSQDKAA
jgi:YjbE family integral membrane protein